MSAWPTTWQLPDKNKDFILSPSVVIMWAIDIDAITLDFHSILMLSSIEQERAARFANSLLRERFLKTHIVLRELLSRYLDIPAKDIIYYYGEHGKPLLADYPNIHFNLSHSENLALCAFSVDAPVGVDIQYHRDVDYQSLAKRFFSIKSYEYFNQAEIAQQKDLFFSYWCAYEALLKSLGIGVAHLAEHDIDIRDNKIFLMNNDDQDKHWTSLLLPMMPSVSAAVVLPVKSAQVQLNRFIE